MDDRPSILRQSALLLVAFVATLVLLVGGRALIGQAGGAPPVAGGSASAGVASLAPAGGTPSGPGVGLTPAPPPIGPDPSGTVVLTGAGDIAVCGSDGARQTSDLLLRQEGLFFTAGDNAYDDGTAAEFADCYDPTWGRVKDRTVLPAAGNHDWKTAGAAGYLGYFGAIAAPEGVTWYSRDIGAWHIVVLDSDCDQVGGCTAASPQGRWLAADLAASSARCTLAIWHHPRFSSGEHGDDDQVAPFWDLLHRDGAELVINGHDHDYERFAPQDPSGKEERPGGIREIVVGTGGAELRTFGRTAPNSELRLAGTAGVLRLTLHPANYDWEFLPVSGEVADSGSTICH
ncbi:MAG TPA: metallophosphoesterase [Candidatus Limnocylindrales bacterium]|jgi:3',5'-cyclic AMP phosphodiesterase CpdA